MAVTASPGLRGVEPPQPRQDVDDAAGAQPRRLDRHDPTGEREVPPQRKRGPLLVVEAKPVGIELPGLTGHWA